MPRDLIAAVTALVFLNLFAGPASADDAALRAEQLANQRARIETATSLMALAKIDKDPQMLAIAARLLAGTGPVAIPGQTSADGKPVFYDPKAMLEEAKAQGAIVAESAATAMASPLPGPQYCAIGYWRETCDYNNYCRWEYVC